MGSRGNTRTLRRLGAGRIAAIGAVVVSLVATALVFGTAGPASATTPTFTSVSPTSGNIGGGTVITITGLSFDSDATVTVGGAACTSLTVVSATSITCTTPAGVAGAVNVVVTNPSSGAPVTATGTGAFTYQADVAVLNSNGGVTSGDGLRIKIGKGWRSIVRNNKPQTYSTSSGRWRSTTVPAVWNANAAEIPYNGVMLVIGSTVVCWGTGTCYLTTDVGGTTLTQAVWDSAVTTMTSATSATTVLEKTLAGVLYRLTMTTDYISPSSYADVTYALTIPTGTNTANVRLYDGIDMYLDANDYGPVKSFTSGGSLQTIVQYNATAVGGFREISGYPLASSGGSWTGAYFSCLFGSGGANRGFECPNGSGNTTSDAGGLYGPYSGTDYPNLPAAAPSGDSGAAIAWNLGTVTSPVTKRASLYFGALSTCSDCTFAPTFTASTPPTTGTAAAAYSSYTFTASGSTPMAFTVLSGSLPTGLALSSAGVLSGTPTVAGTYTFVVKAANGTSPDATTASITITIAAASSGGGSAGGGASGGSSSTPVVDSTPTPTPTPTATVAPAVSLDPIPNQVNANIPATGVPQGGSVFLVNGAPAAVSVAPNAQRAATGLDVSGPDFTMKLSGRGGEGDPLGLGGKSQLILQAPVAPTRRSGAVRSASAGVRSAAMAKCVLREPLAVSSGTGFQAGSPVKMYILPSTYLGELTADASGSYSGSLPVPAGVKAGAQTLQVNGFSSAGAVRSLSLGITVIPARVVTTKTKKGTVFFEPLSTVISPQGQATLNALVRKARKQGVRTVVVGFVQETATTSNDDSLSTRRARNVASYLRERGLKGAHSVRGNGVAGPGDSARRVNVSVSYQSGC